MYPPRLWKKRVSDDQQHNGTRWGGEDPRKKTSLGHTWLFSLHYMVDYGRTILYSRLSEKSVVWHKKFKLLWCTLNYILFNYLFFFYSYIQFFNKINNLKIFMYIWTQNTRGCWQMWRLPKSFLRTDFLHRYLRNYVNTCIYLYIDGIFFWDIDFLRTQKQRGGVEIFVQASLHRDVKKVLFSYRILKLWTFDNNALEYFLSTILKQVLCQKVSKIAINFVNFMYAYFLN